ncbi:hypothetical protein QO003_000681 [Arthrobacter silviterrae]|uniref:Translation initiation factor 2 n=1 Tax=Arthrobacter silviterrae TaxID=2026658 RepID=A0ABX0DE46_9MICC|nr:hypothetical protein [Arthrobacter silviterrae]MDQ0276378.1 hypothetical protein [Arthrobacter silviterrae]NGN82442.1 hypothetical protein [Arthrobacter silviterrae]
MSKETEPVRSRRELRDVLAAQAAGTPGQPPAAPRPAPATPPAPVPPASAPMVDRHGRRGSAAATDATAATAGDAGAPAARERSSQTRARDRAALRAYKELLEPAAAPVDPLPSRRALRQAQLDAERAPVTSVNPVVKVAVNPAPDAVPPATAAPGSAPVSRPAPAPLVHSAPPAVQTPATDLAPGAVSAPGAEPATPAVPAPHHHAGPFPAAAGQEPNRRRGGRRAAASAAPDARGTARAGQSPSGPAALAHPNSIPVVGAPVVAAPRAEPGAPATAPPAVPPAAGHSGAGTSGVGTSTAGPGTSGAPVPYYPVSAGIGLTASQAPSSEELQALAEQRAQAERAAVLSQRAQARERLLAESAKSRRTAADPTSTNNLAMVTPMEFIEVPGLDRPVLRPPATTHVPIVTMSNPKQRTAKRTPATNAASNAAAVSPEAARFDAALAARPPHRPGLGNRPLTGGRSSTLKRAEAMAAGAPAVPATAVPTVQAPPSGPAATPAPAVAPGAHAAAVPGAAAPGPEGVTRTQMPPMPADYAHGLEPLDAVTAGLGRTQRNLFIQWGSIILGGAALVAGAVMFITALAR